jgi:serine/threonine protein kinase
MDDDQPTTNGPGRCLGGRFVLLDAIGVGGGAVVVRARDRQLPRHVAVKLLRSRDADLRRRFVQESEILTSIDHPSIVRVLAHGEDSDELYTALELIDGPDLREHLVQTGPLPWRQVIELGIQVADALEVVHRQGLIHRDVKPDNLMLASSEPLRVKLIDFGVARITENYRTPTGAATRRPTDMGKALGTPGYLPLEAGLVAPNASFDVFGLGATLYQLLTGKLPEEPLLSLREAHPGCDAPEDLGLVLAAALALEPEDRTQTAAELGRALAAVRAAHPNRGAPSVRLDGRYELIGLAGTGAKADACLAVHRGTGHDVVLKFLRSTAPFDSLRFTREAKLLETFNHPALPRFYDYAPEAQPPYIVMAHAPGRPASRLCSPPRLAPAEVAAVGVKLAKVLAEVHARGVLHRDINANNVLIDETGAVTLLDFGCAELGEKFYDVPAGERRYLTPPEARIVIPDGGIGTLAWSAPEVRAGTGWTDRSDVYSMAHLLFRLLTGKVPVKGADPPTDPGSSGCACPDELASAIMRALRVDPKGRPSAAEFAELLEESLESEVEVHARVLAMATPAGRPALRLVPTGPQAPTDWTEHPIPEADSEPLTPAVLAQKPASEPLTPAALAQQPAPSARARHRRPWATWTAAIGVMALGLGWWLGNTMAPRTHEHVALAVSPPVAPHDVIVPASAPATSPSAPPALPSVRDVLATTAPALRRCAEHTGGLLIVQFTTAAGRETFDAVSVSGLTSPTVDGCIRDATAGVRFQPQGAEIFTREYMP